MDLSTRYLGLSLPHPLLPGASPLADDLDTVRRLEDAGAAAIVMRSLFEEQLILDEVATFTHTEGHDDSFAEALSFFPRSDAFALGPDEYLEHLRRIKSAVRVPVVASLNGVTPGGWLRHAALLQQAGADALELNVFALGADPDVSGTEIEDRTVQMLDRVKRSVTIPVAVKLSPFYASLAHFARRLDEAGADGLIVFNRFYQADVDVENLEVEPKLRLSTSAELLLRLRWLAILSGRVRASLAVTGGVHTVIDVVKAVMTGANAVQLVSVLLEKGPQHLTVLRDGLTHWLEEHGYESLEQMRGSMNLASCPNPTAYSRANYTQILQSWHGG